MLFLGNSKDDLLVLSDIIFNLDFVIIFALFPFDIEFPFPLRHAVNGDIIFFFNILKLDFCFIFNFNIILIILT